MSPWKKGKPIISNMESNTINIIAQKLHLAVKQVDSVCQLHKEGATIPFMARYRKEMTNNLDEVSITAIVEQLAYFTELDKRKESVLKTIGEQGKLTPELRDRIVHCMSAAELEDIYLPFKPKRKTRATQAMEKGLEPLARFLFEQNEGKVEEQVKNYITESVKDSKEALQGARDIMAEWISEKEEARALLRQLFADKAILTSKVYSPKKEEEGAMVYKDYFDFSEPLAKCPSHRLLAIRRGEKEEFLLMDISIDKLLAIQKLETIFIRKNNEAAGEVKKAVEDSYARLLKPSIENEFRLLSKNKADEEAIRVFSENLRQLLLSPPLGSRRVLAIDPGFRTGCKVVCLDEQGNLLHHSTVYPHPPQHNAAESSASIKRLVATYSVEAIAIGNGTAGRETETWVRNIDFGKALSIFMVNESGASIYSASEVAREEFPDQDVTVRGAISIGRRLIDPLSELVKIDAKSIGVGQYQHDVNGLRLKEGLDRVVESAVNYVGVDVNTASKHLLQYVSGISSTLAANIVLYRTQHGPFKSRTELKKVPLMGPKAFEQCAGFLKIVGGNHPLDNSSVHPERYGVVEKMAADVQATLEELIKKADLRQKINKKLYLSETIGEFTIEDILSELEKPGRDPRGTVEEFRFDETIKKLEDVKVGMRVPGIVTNLTAFGVFVDIGVKQDGLVHVSQLSNVFVTDPSSVVKLHQNVVVTVTGVDVARKRIALSMKEVPPANSGGEKPRGEKPKIQVNKTLPLNDYQKKLLELKKRFI